jgi:NAD(P)-dependent dehydrogenase (short-subunit alcohol dehydrogenase family)
MNSEFSGKVALVAGGTGGLGRAVTLAFLAGGAKVIVTYRQSSELEALRAEAAKDSILEGHPIDVTDEAQVENFVKACYAQNGRLDILVNTVGGYKGGTTLWDTDAGALEKMITLNVCTGFLLARAAVPVMIQQGHGAIVNIAAKAALEPAAKGAVYAASKAAALAMFDALAAELKGTGVRSNSVLPNIIDTEANRKAMPKADFSTWPKPEEIARVILFLCSDDAKVVHGAAIPVYGMS